DQTPVARPVRFGDAHYRPSQPIAAACDLALRLELRARIDVLGARGGRLVEPPVPRRAVDADRAAVYETLDAGFLADVEQISRAVHVDGAVIGLAGVRFVLCRRQMKDRVDRRDELAYQRQIVEAADSHRNALSLESLAALGFDGRTFGAE